MNLRSFKPSDVEEINIWYHRRYQHFPADMVPENGLIWPGVAAGFLYTTDAKGFCLLDGFVTKPDAGLRRRVVALHLIARTLIDLARDREFTRIMALCRSRGMQRLAGKFGLKPIGMYAMLGKEF